MFRFGKGEGGCHGRVAMTLEEPAVAAGAAAAAEHPADSFARQALASFDANLQSLTELVASAKADRDTYTAWQRQHPRRRGEPEPAGAPPSAYMDWYNARPKLTRYDPALTGSVLDQRPTATRIAGERAWKARGRRLKPDATPIMIGAGKKLTRPPVHRGIEIENPRLQKALGLKPVVVGYERTQAVYDQADTEPVNPEPVSAEQAAAAERAIADMHRAAQRLGLRLFHGGAEDTGTELSWTVNSTLINGRDTGGHMGEGTDERGVKVRYAATPGGLELLDQVRCLAHEFAHAHLGHDGGLLRFFAEDYEVEAETFAHQLCAAYDVPSPESAFYIVNHARLAPERQVARRAGNVRDGFERFLAALA